MLQGWWGALRATYHAWLWRRCLARLTPGQGEVVHEQMTQLLDMIAAGQGPGEIAAKRRAVAETYRRFLARSLHSGPEDGRADSK